jgi:hypothetical protein
MPHSCIERQSLDIKRKFFNRLAVDASFVHNYRQSVHGLGLVRVRVRGYALSNLMFY